MKDYSKKHLPAGLKKSLLAAAAFLLAALFVMSAANLLVVSLAAKYIIPFESAVSRGADSCATAWIQRRHCILPVRRSR